MAKLQIAVDLMTEEQAALLADEIHDVIDIFEVGTPMIVRDGCILCAASRKSIRS